MNATAYPRDFAGLVRAHRELTRIRTRYPMPLPLDAPGAAAVITARGEIAWQPAQ
ncbi:hypothetical protein [Streptomyces sp. P17]|uniref:hypothetical protein n=1 Tax=Streptomyces sp. P17 TaxID=3074716 RepID=UPI0028F403E6|nr:hypothetical protein [Streptomyces sp. P17]MDT9698096.1 hypothetical protein [Streptomyces sp. P17]